MPPPHYRPGGFPGSRPAQDVRFHLRTDQHAGKVEFTQGTLSARIKLPAARVSGPRSGRWAAGPWPEAGEIDVMENVGEPDWVSAALHGPGYSGETPARQPAVLPRRGPRRRGGTSTAARWEPRPTGLHRGRRSLYRATRPMVEYYGPWAFDNGKYLILNLAVGGTYPFKTNGIALALPGPRGGNGASPSSGKKSACWWTGCESNRCDACYDERILWRTSSMR